MICRPEYDMKMIGQNLRRLRIAKKLSVDDVRKYLCLGSVQAIYKYEKGKCYPQADTMFALMELYGADLKDITEIHEEGDQPSSVFYMVTGGRFYCHLSRMMTIEPSPLSPSHSHLIFYRTCDKIRV